MKTKAWKIVISLALILLPLTAVRAASEKAESSIYVSKDEIISGNLYAAGKTITVDGTISGDLIGAAQSIVVNGRIEGDVIGAAQDITINGEVGGNVRVAGDSVNINGSVARNVNAFGSNIIMGSNSRVGWDIYLAGATADVRGTVDGSLSGQAGQANLSGKIGKNVNLDLENGGTNQKLSITPTAIVNGDIIYTSKNAALVSPQANVSGQVQQKTPATKTSNWLMLWTWGRLFSIFAALAVGLVLVFIGKNVTIKIIEKMESSPLKMLLPGLAFMFILPPLALVLAITIIGLPLSLITGASWLIATYLAKIFTAILLGQFIIKKIFRKSDWPLVSSLVIGVIICWLLFSIPFVGWLFGLISIWLGLGGIWSYASYQLKHI